MYVNYLAMYEYTIAGKTSPTVSYVACAWYARVNTPKLVASMYVFTRWFLLHEGRGEGTVTAAGGGGDTYTLTACQSPSAPLLELKFRV